MRLFEQLQTLQEADPWMLKKRVLVGSLSSRELVKEVYLEKQEIIPGHITSSFAALAAEICEAYHVNLQLPLSMDSRVDALMLLSQNATFKKLCPRLSSQIRDRSVARKLARFVTAFDFSWTTESEIRPFVDYYEEKNKETAVFLKFILELWNQGALTPWSEAHQLREAIEILKSRDDVSSKVENLLSKDSQIYLWAFHECAPLEEEFLKLLAQFAETSWLIPRESSKDFESDIQKLNVHVRSYDHQQSKVDFWKPHSAIDEMDFAIHQVLHYQREGVAFKNIALYVPNDDFYKRTLRSKLFKKEIPLFDPTLKDAMPEHPETLFLVDWLNVISEGMPLPRVLTFFTNTADEPLLNAVFQEGFTRGVSRWKEFLAKHKHPVIELMCAMFSDLSAHLNLQQLHEVFSKYENTYKEVTGHSLKGFLDFIVSAYEGRDYLRHQRLRFSKWLEIFEEWVTQDFRKESLRRIDGIQMIGHGSVLPLHIDHAFFLSTHTMNNGQQDYDLWNWQSSEFQFLWSKLHLSKPHAVRKKRLEEFMRQELYQAKHVVMSAPDYDLSGKPVSAGPVFQLEYEKFNKPLYLKTGSANIGLWLTQNAKPESQQEWINEGYAKKITEKPLSISKFEDYLRCPFLFFARHILKTDDIEEPGLSASALFKGQVLHGVLEKLLKRSLEYKSIFLQTEIHDLVHKAIDTEISDYQSKPSHLSTGMFKDETLIKNFKEELVDKVLHWVEWEREYRSKHPEVKTLLLEAPVEFEIPLKGSQTLKLRGIVDRIDGDDDHVLIVDYKTGQSPFLGKELLLGYGVQLLGYLIAASRMFNKTAVGAYYLNVGRATAIKGGVFFKQFNKKYFSIHHSNRGLTDQPVEDVMSTVMEFWQTEAENLVQGRFTAKPRQPKKDCPNCKYYGVCGFDYLKTAADEAGDTADA